MLIGLDFDNTIACYDEAISLLADNLLELPSELPKTKQELCNYLRKNDREVEWTHFQGVLYGPGMVHARPHERAIETMQHLESEGHELMIVSHRSKHPYAGPPYDLHAAAHEWVKNRLQSAGLFLNKRRAYSKYEFVNFLETRDEKLSMIKELGCHLFVDDLLEILEATSFPKGTAGVLFDPTGKHSHINEKLTIATWEQLPAIISMLK
jgi:hypothetical protein